MHLYLDLEKDAVNKAISKTVKFKESTLKVFAPTTLTALNAITVSIVVFILFVAVIFLIEKLFIKNFISSAVFLLELSSFPLFCFVAMLPLGFIPIFYVDYRNITTSFEVAYHILFYMLVVFNFIIILDLNSNLFMLSYTKHFIYAIIFLASGCLYLTFIWFISSQGEFETLKKCKVIYLAISYVMGIYNSFYLCKYILSTF